MTEELATQSLATKYRPIKTNDVIGQDDFKNLIRSIKETHKVPKAILFTGDTGCGKTTLARVLARNINRTKEISPAQDIFEYNIGTNGTAEDIRDLVNKLKYMPRTKGHKSIYILDEVHRLTKTSASALLKEIEEPPEHVVFILCTNEPDALLPTIRNRCQKVVLKPYSEEQIVQLLTRVCEQENVEIKEDYLKLIAQGCGGQLREALVILQGVMDQIHANKELDAESLEKLIKSETGYDIQIHVSRLIVSLYKGNYLSATQQVVACEDLNLLLTYCLSTNRMLIKAIYKPKNPNKFPGDINAFNVPYPVLQILNEGLYSGYSKIHEKAVESLLPVMALRVQEHLLNIKEKSLNAAFNLQDVFFKEIGRCAQSFAELQRRQLGI